MAKTTTTVSLGAVLAEMGYKVLLIDLDPQANLSLALGAEPNTIQQSSASLLIENVPVAQVIRETSVPGLDIIPANNQVGMVERFLPGRQDYEYTLQKAFNQLSEDDYVRWFLYH